MLLPEIGSDFSGVLATERPLYLLAWDVTFRCKLVVGTLATSASAYRVRGAAACSMGWATGPR